MHTHSWTISVHNSSGPYLTYSLTSCAYDRYLRPLPDQLVVSTCKPEELPKCLDAMADLIVFKVCHQELLEGDQLPF